MSMVLRIAKAQACDVRSHCKIQHITVQSTPTTCKSLHGMSLLDFLFPWFLQALEPGAARSLMTLLDFNDGCFPGSGDRTRSHGKSSTFRSLQASGSQHHGKEELSATSIDLHHGKHDLWVPGGGDHHGNGHRIRNGHACGGGRGRGQIGFHANKPSSGGHQTQRGAHYGGGGVGQPDHHGDNRQDNFSYNYSRGGRGMEQGFHEEFTSPSWGRGTAHHCDRRVGDSSPISCRTDRHRTDRDSGDRSSLPKSSEGKGLGRGASGKAHKGGGGHRHGDIPTIACTPGGLQPAAGESVVQQRCKSTANERPSAAPSDGQSVKQPSQQEECSKMASPAGVAWESFVREVKGQERRQKETRSSPLRNEGFSFMKW